jgi:hypothetical protein
VRAALRAALAREHPSEIALERAWKTLAIEDWRLAESRVRALLARDDIGSAPQALALYGARDEPYARAIACEMLEDAADRTDDLIDVAAMISARSARRCPEFIAWLDELRCGVPRGTACLCTDECKFDHPAAEVAVLDAELRDGLIQGGVPDRAAVAYWLAALHGSTRPPLVWRRLCYDTPNDSDAVFAVACNTPPNVTTIQAGAHYHIDDVRRRFEPID